MSKKQWYSSKQFTLDVVMGKHGALMEMQILDGFIHTSQMPYVSQVLKTMFPSVLESQCFNDMGLPFCEEVKSTEIGHLFEHVLLEHLCLLKMDRGDVQTVHNGRTSWNWQKNPQGHFSIYVDVPLCDRPIFMKALARTILLARVLDDYSGHPCVLQ